MPSFEDFAKRFWRIEGDRKLGAQSVHAATQSKRNGKHTQGGDAIRGEHAQGGGYAIRTRHGSCYPSL